MIFEDIGKDLNPIDGEQGIVTFFNEEQQANAYESISFTVDGNSIVIKDLQPLKAEYPILMTEEGIDIFDNAEQSLKTQQSISLIEGDKITFASEEHPSKQ